MSLFKIAISTIFVVCAFTTGILFIVEYFQSRVHIKQSISTKDIGTYVWYKRDIVYSNWIDINSSDSLKQVEWNKVLKVAEKYKSIKNKTKTLW